MQAGRNATPAWILFVGLWLYRGEITSERQDYVRDKLVAAAEEPRKSLGSQNSLGAFASLRVEIEESELAGV